jgi:polyhydroxyalkanoate synthase
MADEPNDPARIISNLYEAGQAVLRQFAAAPPDASAAAGRGAQPPAADNPMAQFLAATQQLTGLQTEFVKQMSSYWSGAPWLNLEAPAEAAPKDEDKRFAAEAWRHDPRFDFVRRSFAAYASFLQGAVESAPVDEKTKAQARYGVRQFVDALSPSNFFFTNPEAMRLAMESGGQSIVQGMGLFFDDLAKGRISTTDDSAYEVGLNIAATPGSVVFENELIQLIQYAPTTDRVFERPLVMIPPAINKFYIMDLQPENSLVRHVVELGHTAFMLSWRNVDESLGHLTWDDYLELGVIKAIDVAREITGAQRVNTLGFCIGGTLLACALAVMAAKDRRDAASMTLLTTMLDFSDAGEIGALVTEQSVAAREASIGNGGLMHGKELGFTFTSLRANDLMWQYVTNSYLKGKSPPAFDMLYWNADCTNLPGPMFCWYVRNCYLENKLRDADATVQCGVPVDLSLIDVPTLIYASRDDHIVPWRTAYRSTELLAGDTTFVLGASGHIAGVINPPAKNKRNHWIGGDEGVDPDRWFETANNVPGSWWPEWTRWLATHSGAQVAAPKKPGNRKYKPIEPAPGRYVKVKAG